MASNQLAANTEVVSQNGNRYVVDKLLGAGSQGEVYAVMHAGQQFALKWYLPGNDTLDQAKLLHNLVETGAPSKRFLWPIELVKDATGKGLGYVMELRKSDYGSMVDLMKGRIVPGFRGLCTAGVGLAYQLTPCSLGSGAVREVTAYRRGMRALL